MSLRNLFFSGAMAGLLILAGCKAKTSPPVSSRSGQSSSQSISSQAEESSVTRPQSAASETASAVSVAAKSAASRNRSARGTVPASSGAAPSVESKDNKGYEISTDGTWEAYDSNRDNCKLHVRKKDGSGEKVIVNDIVLCPCLAGNWVYYFNTLDEIDKIRLDGSGKTKVCSTDGFGGLCGSTAITASYKNGAIVFRTQQMPSGGDNSSYPAYFYSLDTKTGKVTKVKS